MYALNYLIYHLRPYGIVIHSQALPEKLTDDNNISLQSSSSQSENKSTEVGHSQPLP